MPWNKVDVMEQKQALIEALLLPGASVRGVCEAHGVSRQTAYKWLKRYQEKGLVGLEEYSREPQHSPRQIPEKEEALIVQTHKQYPYWGPKKLRHYLINQGYDEARLPSSSTFARVLKRQGCEVIKSHRTQTAKKRFEHAYPNALWQMDFKGSFMTTRERCYPLTILDDHSRYSVGLYACRNEEGMTVKQHLIRVFRRLGLPEQINVDNGNPWGSSHLDSYTRLAVWLIKQGIRLSHSSPYHPQTNGKDERFHRTLKLEMLHHRQYYDCQSIQSNFETWQHHYNYERPHEALGGKPPASRYSPSPRMYKESFEKVSYEEGETVRKVGMGSGLFRFKGQRYRAGKGFCGEYIALRETAEPDEYALFFMNNFIKKFKLKEGV